MDNLDLNDKFSKAQKTLESLSSKKCGSIDIRRALENLNNVRQQIAQTRLFRIINTEDPEYFTDEWNNRISNKKWVNIDSNNNKRI